MWKYNVTAKQHKRNIKTKKLEKESRDIKFEIAKLEYKLADIKHYLDCPTW